MPGSLEVDARRRIGTGPVNPPEGRIFDACVARLRGGRPRVAGPPPPPPAPTAPAGQQRRRGLVAQEIRRVVRPAGPAIRLPVPPVDTTKPGNGTPDLYGRVNRACLHAQVEQAGLLRLVPPRWRVHVGTEADFRKHDVLVVAV